MSNQTGQRKRATRTSGFTLIEVMIALLILSVGALGLAGLQISGINSSLSTYDRSIAAMQANDLAERMWAGLPALYTDTGDGTCAFQDGDDEEAEQIVAAWRADHADDEVLEGAQWHHTIEYKSLDNGDIRVVLDIEIREKSMTHTFRLPDVCSDGSDAGNGN